MTAVKALFAAIFLISAPAYAGDVTVDKVTFKKQADGTYNFRVTLSHGDTGWDHYADAWEVVLPDGTVAGTRILAHPHVEEQPFTRSKTGIVIPEGVTQVTVRGRDSVHGLGKAVVVDLTK
ncbi:MAG: hypothetical protein AAFO61_10865 [Pseudomonadota bacterium]